MFRISRKLYNECLGDRDKMKALAAIVVVKNKKPTSVITNYSHKEFSQLLGVKIKTASKLFNILKMMGLVQTYSSKGIKCAKFLSVRNKEWTKANVNIERFNKLSIKDVVFALDAILIVEVQTRKEYIRQQSETWCYPKNLRGVKKRSKLIKRGLIERKQVEVNGKKKTEYKSMFKDCGISYRYIAASLGVGFNRVKQIVDFGVKFGAFTLYKQKEVIFLGEGAKFSDILKPTYVKLGYAVFIKANKYTLAP